MLKLLCYYLRHPKLESRSHRTWELSCLFNNQHNNFHYQAMANVISSTVALKLFLIFYLKNMTLIETYFIFSKRLSMDCKHLNYVRCHCLHCQKCLYNNSFQLLIQHFLFCNLTFSCIWLDILDKVFTCDLNTVGNAS